RRGEYWDETAAGPAPLLDFFDLKGIVEAMARDLHLPETSYRQSSTDYLHPGKSAEFLISNKAVGNFGEMHPRIAQAYGLADRTVMAGEFDLETILSAVPERYAYIPVPRFPAALRDIAVVVDESVTAERLLKEIRTAGGDLLCDIRLFDVYRG